MLTPQDFRSSTWKQLSSSLRERLQELRELNDSPSLGLERTASIRGSIEEVKRILALADAANASPAVAPGELAGDDDYTTGL